MTAFSNDRPLMTTSSERLPASLVSRSNTACLCEAETSADSTMRYLEKGA